MSNPRIEVLPIEQGATTDLGNINRHTVRGGTLVENSLRKRGAFRSIASAGKDAETLVVYAGNLTLEKAVEAGFTEIVNVHVRGNQLVNVVRDDVAPGSAEAIALGLEDNESAAKSYNPDIDILAALAAGDNAILAQLRKEDKVFGGMLEGMGLKDETQDAPVDLNRAAELQKKWGTETGQLWKIGEHRLLCGDSTKREDVERVMDIPLNLCVTDPPYGVEYDANWRNEAAEKGLLSYAASRVGQVENDFQDDWTETWKLFTGDVLYCWHADRRASNTQRSLEDAGFEMRAQLIWAKPHFVIGRGHYAPRHEPCWYCVRKGKTASWIGDNLQDTLWNISLDKNVEGGHSTQKPLECMSRPISNHSGDVYEPFAGSGTTLVACQNLGRKARAIEISPAYVAVCLERMSQAFPGIEIEKI